MKQKKKPTMLEKKIKYGSPAAYCSSKRHKAAVQLNKELNGMTPVGNSCTFWEK